MPNHLAKVSKKMSIYAKRRVKNVLSGNYGSVFKGRSMDFDDLRPYEYGDDVKDIDWKASARSRVPMSRRYIAIRKHNIMIVADSGRNMAALAPSGESKIEVATFAASVIAWIANRNDDLVGITFGNSASNTRIALKEGVSHIENCLTKYEKSVSLESDPANLNALLSYISKNFRERMFLFIITDTYNASQVSPELLRRLRVRHEIMIITVEDSDVTNSALAKNEVRDVVSGARIPTFLRKNRKLQNAEAAMRKNIIDTNTKNFRHLGICSSVLEGTETAVQSIFRMLEEQKHVRR